MFMEINLVQGSRLNIIKLMTQQFEEITPHYEPVKSSNSSKEPRLGDLTVIFLPTKHLAGQCTCPLVMNLHISTA